MGRNDVEVYQDLIDRREKIKAKLNNAQGRLEELMRQLEAQGFDTVDDAKDWVKEHRAQIQNNKDKIENHLRDARSLVKDIEGMLR